MAISLDQLRASFRGFITTPSEAKEYRHLTHRWSPNEQGRPGLILEPVCEADVSLAVRHAASNSLDLAVVAGGHSFMGASSSRDGSGVHIDLRRMRQVVVDNDDDDDDDDNDDDSFGRPGLLTVEGGASVGEVAAACVARGVALSVPAVKELGFFGWALGGGAGWALGADGFCIDAWVSARVVLASGEVVTASRDSHPELFWGLKGAGYSLGVVTSVTMAVRGLLPGAAGGKVFFAELYYPRPAFEALFAAATEYARARQGDEDTLAMVYLPVDEHGGPAGETMQVILYFHGGDEAEARRRFKPVLDVHPHLARRCGLEWLHVSCDSVEALMPHTRRYADGTLFAAVSPEAWLPVIDKVRAWAEVDDSRRKGTAFFLGVYNWRKTLSRHGDARFDSAWPVRSRLPPAGEPSWRDFALYISTDKAEEEDEAIRVSKEIVSFVRAKQEEVLGLERGFDWPVYPNGSLLPGTTGEYVYKDHYPRLQKVKAKYDPGNLFHKKHPIELPEH